MRNGPEPKDTQPFADWHMLLARTDFDNKLLPRFDTLSALLAKKYHIKATEIQIAFPVAVESGWFRGAR